MKQIISPYNFKDRFAMGVIPIENVVLQQCWVNFARTQEQDKFWQKSGFQLLAGLYVKYIHTYIYNLFYDRTA
jgi:hypothetical protein